VNNKLNIEFLMYIIIGFYITIHDIKHKIIPDVVILPSIIFLIFLRFLDGSINLEYLYAIMFIVTVFVFPILLNLRFGGGDIRFGIFSAILLSFPNIVWFIIISSLFHLLVLLILKKKEYPFAPSMFMASIVVYLTNETLWSLI